MAKDNRLEFPVTLYGALEEYSQVLTKGRCRIFYKGGNRNRTYITDEFAEKLISTLPYTPIKGIYDNTAEDYTDHGRQRYEGRVYGIVPENPNFAWETHLDEDGVSRTYACVDVLLFTSIYKEAGEIVGQAQSMELYAPSIKGDWKYIDGKKFFVFDEGCFLGLQVLGSDVEPCFEGASFYVNEDLIARLEYVLKELNAHNEEALKNIEGGEKMTVNDFKLSDNQKYNMLFSLLNPNFNEEGEWELTYMISDVYDEYALAFNIQENGYERVYYKKDDETDSLELLEREVTYIVDVTETEKKALQALHELNNGFENVDTNYSDLQNDNQALHSKVDEYENTINSLEEEKGQMEVSLNEAKENFANAEATIEELNSECEALREFKLNAETAEKLAVVDKYAEKLDESVINEFKEKISEYTVTELEKELAFALVNNTPALFTNEGVPLYPKDDNEETGLGKILSKYE